MHNSLKLALMAIATTTATSSLPLASLMGSAALCSGILFPPASQAQTSTSGNSRTGSIVAVRNESGILLYINQPASPHSFTKQIIVKTAPPPASATDPEIESAIIESSSRHGLDPALVRAVIHAESNFAPLAVSRKGAQGLMQLMPATAAALCVTNPFDPKQNVDAGVRYLKHLVTNFGGDVPLALAAFNAGEAAVHRSRGVPNFAETHKYLQRISNFYSHGDGIALSTHSRSFATPSVRIFHDQHGVLNMSNTE